MGTIKNYELLGKIGSGTYGTVYKCRSITDKKEYAFKQIDARKLSDK